MPRIPTLLMIGVALSTMSAAPAADADRDEAAGLRVRAPEDYTVQRDAGPSVRFFVRKPLDPQSTGCTIDAQFLPAIDAADAGLAHALAERAGREKNSWRDKALVQIMSMVLVQESHPYSQDGMEGLQVLGWPRRDTGGSGTTIDRSMRALVILLKMPNGYVKVDCRAETAAFPSRRPEFEQVVHGVSLAR